jgi:hypothetical protein
MYRTGLLVADRNIWRTTTTRYGRKYNKHKLSNAVRVSIQDLAESCSPLVDLLLAKVLLVAVDEHNVSARWDVHWGE